MNLARSVFSRSVLSVLLALGAAATTALAQPATRPVAVQGGTASVDLQHFVTDVKTLHADFTQVQTDEDGEELSRSTGTFLLARPDRFRWDYQKPYQQLLVNDGESLWIYEPDLAQVTRRSSAQALSGTPAELLLRGDLLTDSFAVEDRGLSAGVRELRLTPKGDQGDFAYIDMWLAAGVPQRIVFHDQLGSSTDVRFSDIRLNQPLDDSLLAFNPPEGVEVVSDGV